MKRLTAFGALCGALACRGEAPPAPAPAAPREEAPTAQSRVELSEAALRNADLDVAQVTPSRFGPQITLPAVIEGDPMQFARVGARVPGRVVALRVALGASVRAGDVLLEIDSVELHEVSTEYLTAVARDRQAQDAVRRARSLSAEQVGATQDLQRAEADAAVARAALQEAEEHLHFLGLRDADIQGIRTHTSHGQARSAVRSPIEGTVTTLRASIGQVVGGTEEVAVVSRTSRVWCALRVYEQDLPDGRVGAAVRFRPSGRPDAEARTGVVSFLSGVVDRETHTAEARFLLENADGRLSPGMSGAATLETATGGPGLWLPVESVQPHDGHRVVFVRVSERVFEARTVRVGEERGGRVPVQDGLRGGESVVVRGALTLRGELERDELAEED